MKDYNWIKTDSWIKENVTNLSIFRWYLISKNKSKFTYPWHGEIKHCPTCEETRVTDCCACGCGSCYTCGHRWCCYGFEEKPQKIDWKEGWSFDLSQDINHFGSKKLAKEFSGKTIL